MYLSRSVLRTLFISSLTFQKLFFSSDGKISIETEGASGAPLDIALRFLLHQLFVPALQEVIANFILLKLINQLNFFQGPCSP